jgi:cytochrome P450
LSPHFDSTSTQSRLVLSQLESVLKDADSSDVDSFVRRFIESTAVNRETMTSLKDADFDREELKYVLRDFFTAGEETTATGLRWALLLLANHPHVQNRIQDEVDSVVGKDRQPSLDDESQMSYTQAVILESLRRHTPTPLGLFRATTCDTQVGINFIPENTTVILIILHRKNFSAFTVQIL